MKSKAGSKAASASLPPMEPVKTAAKTIIRSGFFQQHTSVKKHHKTISKIIPL
ncbi:MAG TPA: hypothetical protein VM802_14795 [Chitinophaga sp.]|uniref:hypothetical protein n=1 Tax=Chitinophaga sp. TaxID=1869181 RepID=UPI002D1B168C|nr:hypothetical protein [Chitinophaga sp.]HVI46140.1 hypothetical protein [Chitinophaga sp.]